MATPGPSERIACVPGAAATGKIAFVGAGYYNFGIYVVNAADGSGLTRLFDPGNPPPGVWWSPDGKRIAFDVLNFHPITLRGFTNIFVMNADGSSPTNLTNVTAGNHRYFSAWSPDGTKIASASFGIYVMNADGSGQTKLTNNRDEDAAWSPDGTKIAFASYRDGNAEIYVMNADGSGQTNLTNNPAQDAGLFGFAWSPDGSHIAFVSDRDGNDEIYVMNADGCGQTRLTNDAADDPRMRGNDRPAWQPQP